VLPYPKHSALRTYNPAKFISFQSQQKQKTPLVGLANGKGMHKWEKSTKHSNGKAPNTSEKKNVNWCLASQSSSAIPGVWVTTSDTTTVPFQLISWAPGPVDTGRRGSHSGVRFPKIQWCNRQWHSVQL
jgi:hypothetical protein